MLKTSKIKIGLFLVLLLVSSFQILDSVALAQPSLSSTIKCDPTLPPSDPGACNIPAFIVFLKNLINYAAGISIPLATGFIVYGAFEIMTAGGNSGKVDSGKKIIFAALIGVAIALGSYLIVNAILNLIPINPNIVK